MIIQLLLTMRKLYPILFIFLIGGVSLGSASELNKISNEDVYIRWNDRKLNWNDFSGAVPANSKFDALTHSAIDMSFSGEKTTLKFNVKSIFDPDKSWKKEGVTSYILKHEQVHFDITEYYSRVLRKKIKTRRFKSFDTVEKEVMDMFNQTFEEASKMQVKYDNDTGHSQNKKKQAKWNKKIKKMLSSLSSFKNPIMKVNVNYLLEK